MRKTLICSPEYPEGNGHHLHRLDPEEEEALASASLKDIMALADILNTNPQVSQSQERSTKVLQSGSSKILMIFKSAELHNGSLRGPTEILRA